LHVIACVQLAEMEEEVMVVVDISRVADINKEVRVVKVRVAALSASHAEDSVI
jgi:hypothetical protein